MGLFSRKKGKPGQTGDTKPTTDAYLESYGRMVERIHGVGGFPLTVFAVAVLVVLVAFVSVVVDALAELMPYLFVFASLLAILGVGVYVLELHTKQSLLRKSMDQHQSLVNATFQKYLESKETFSDNDVSATLLLVDDLLHTRVAESGKAIGANDQASIPKVSS